jgi:hypothetical protein
MTPNMTTRRIEARTPARPFFRLPAALALAALALWSPPSRADLLATCDGYASLITCAATDVGKPCQGGGQCFEMSCSSSPTASTPTKVYRCDACPTIVAAPAATCTLSNMGTACGDGDGGTGTCAIISPWCQSSTGASKVSCQVPATAKPTGPPAGSSAGTSSGCDIAPKPPKPTTIGLGLIAVGLVAFLFDRARRRSR